MARQVIFVGIAPAVGTTSMCALLAAGLAKLRKKVVVIDLCVGERNITSLLIREEYVKHDIFDVLDGGCRLNQAVLSTLLPFLYCLPSASFSQRQAEFSSFNKLLEKLNQTFDFVLVDTSWAFSNFLDISDSEIVVVSNFARASINRLNKLLSILIGNKNTVTRVLFNMLKNEIFATNFCEKNRINMLGCVPPLKNVDTTVQNALLGDINENIEVLAYKLLSQID